MKIKRVLKGFCTILCEEIWSVIINKGLFRTFFLNFKCTTINN